MKRIKEIKQITIILAIMILLNILLNYMFIPRFGINGAAIATTVSFILLCAISMVQVIKIK